MSFFDSYKEIAGNFIGADEKQVLIDEGIPFQITAIQSDPENRFGPRYVASVLVPDPASGTEEERLIAPLRSALAATVTASRWNAAGEIDTSA